PLSPSRAGRVNGPKREAPSPLPPTCKLGERREATHATTEKRVLSMAPCSLGITRHLPNIVLAYGARSHFTEISPVPPLPSSSLLIQSRRRISAGKSTPLFPTLLTEPTTSSSQHDKREKKNTRQQTKKRQLCSRSSSSLMLRVSRYANPVYPVLFPFPSSPVHSTRSIPLRRGHNHRPFPGTAPTAPRRQRTLFVERQLLRRRSAVTPTPSDTSSR
ncbi:unnamed protein product, partial [Ectocarpus sp. 4 AP-2014]